MDEIDKLTEKYDVEYVRALLHCVKEKELNEFAFTFSKDVADIYECITGIKNLKRNPTGFSLDDAPILGLVVRVWKLLKEIINYYERNNGEIIGILERPLIEASVVATYLITNDGGVRTTGNALTRADCVCCVISRMDHHFTRQRRGRGSSRACRKRWILRT